MKQVKTTKSNIKDTPSKVGGRMTLPNTPLKEWLPSSSSLQNVEQRGGICRLLLSSPLSSRNRLPKSPPSSDTKNGEEWLQEARALPLENAPSILIKPFSGRHAAWHAGGIRVGIRVVMVQRFRARCHSVCYSNCYSELLQSHAAIYTPAWSPA